MALPQSTLININAFIRGEATKTDQLGSWEIKLDVVKWHPSRKCLRCLKHFINKGECSYSLAMHVCMSIISILMSGNLRGGNNLGQQYKRYTAEDPAWNPVAAQMRPGTRRIRWNQTPPQLRAVRKECNYHREQPMIPRMPWSMVSKAGFRSKKGKQGYMPMSGNRPR